MAFVITITRRLSVIHNVFMCNSSRKYSDVVVRSLGKKLKKGSESLAKGQAVDLPVEEDPVNLVQYVCGTKLTVDGENVKIKDDSEYPDWLWTLHIGEPKTYKDMDPNTLEYWREVRRIGEETLQHLKSMYPYYRDHK